MSIQIFGTRKCKDTQKAERFFKERGVSFQFIDLNKKGPSAGELENIARSVGEENLIDSGSREYQKRNLEYMEYDPLEEIEENPLLMKTPVVRYKKKATLGYDPETWEQWISEMKG
jgi:arsenate reductase-like glutaredoxin family protein